MQKFSLFFFSLSLSLSLLLIFSVFSITFTACGGGGSGGGTKELTDAEAVAEAAAFLDAEDIIFIVNGDTPSGVTGDFTLPAGGLNGTTITWEEKTDEGNNIVLSGEGNSEAAVTCGFDPYTVTLTATISKGTETETKDISIIVVPRATTKVAAAVDNVTFKMVLVPGGLSFPTGTNDDGTATVDNAYWIGETQVTYELWYKVRTWARVNGYTLDANPGREGNDGTITSGTGADPTAAKQEPVTTINWREAMVWCNALTEWYNANNGTASDLDLVYYTDEDYTTPLRTATDVGSVDSTPGSQDMPYIKAGTSGNTVVDNCTAKGFRLLTGNEWQLAARYRGKDTTNVVTGVVAGVDFDAMEIKWTKGNSASGATTYYNDATDSSGEPGKSANDAVAVYNSYWDGLVWVDRGVISTAEVKTKAPNALGLYDMSGNVWEWAFDQHLLNSWPYRMVWGGGWFNHANFMKVSSCYSYGPNHQYYGLGFRFTRSK